MPKSKLAELKRMGFDESKTNRGEGTITVRCSQCSVLVIAGIACHERGCPNEKRRP